MLTKEKIEAALQKIPPMSERTKFLATTYEEGVEVALQWVLGETPDEDFEFAPNQFEGGDDGESEPKEVFPVEKCLRCQTRTVAHSVVTEASFRCEECLTDFSVQGETR